MIKSHVKCLFLGYDLASCNKGLHSLSLGNSYDFIYGPWILVVCCNKSTSVQGPESRGICSSSTCKPYGTIIALSFSILVSMRFNFSFSFYAFCGFVSPFYFLKHYFYLFIILYQITIKVTIGLRFVEEKKVISLN